MSDVTPTIIVDHSRIALLQACVHLYQDALVEARRCCGCGAGSDQELIADFLLDRRSNPTVLEFIAIEAAFERIREERTPLARGGAAYGPTTGASGGSLGSGDTERRTDER